MCPAAAEEAPWRRWCPGGGLALGAFGAAAFFAFGNALRIGLTSAAPQVLEVRIRCTRLYNHDEAGHVTYRRSPEQIAQGSSWYTSFGFDYLGRSTSSVAHTSSGTTTLFTLGYDSATAPTNCPSVTSAAGRLVTREDSLGIAYFAYDTEGHVTSETLLKPGQSQCLTSNSKYNLTPSTSYTYTDNGNLETITYPQGRGVEYVYGSGADLNRVAEVKVQKRVSGAWTWYTVLTNVLWEPYGGLRRYQGTPPSGSAFTVEYRQGDNPESAPMSSYCTGTWTPGADDHSGRLRALWVSAGQQSLGSGSGDLLRLWYQWRGDAPVVRNSCLLQESTPRTQAYGYDGLLELTMADGGYPSGGSGLAGMAYDGRGNRTSLAQAGASTLTTTYSVASNGDLLSSLSRNDTGGFSRTYAWDKNGRASSVSFGPNSGGADSHSFAYVAGESLTFSTLSIGGATYSYSYDAFNRRGSKQYPSAVTDDFFYDTGHQLLADRGVADVATGAPYPVDDYVWLGGRAAVLVHGLFDSSWVRQDDNGSGSACQRNGEAQACGFYFPVTDHLSTPVLMLDSSARVTGTSELDAFGYPNRGAVSATTGTQPYSNNVNSVLGTFRVANGASGTTVQVRARYAVLETEAANDYVRLEEQSGSTGTSASGATSGPTWSDWLSLTSSGTTKSIDVRFVSNASTTAAGVVGEAFEYRRFDSSAATPFFTSVRFPGQYHDAESDLFENWNRYYDAFTGRYLQPEPMLSPAPLTTSVNRMNRLRRPRLRGGPMFVASFAKTGFAVPSYSYALNNPRIAIDRNGLAPGLGTVNSWVNDAILRDHDDDPFGLLPDFDDTFEQPRNSPGFKDPYPPAPFRNWQERMFQPEHRFPSNTQVCR